MSDTEADVQTVTEALFAIWPEHMAAETKSGLQWGQLIATAAVEALKPSGDDTPTRGSRMRINLLDLVPGDTWRAPTGRMFDVIDRGFIYAGKRYVALHEHGVDCPMLYNVAHLEGLAFERAVAR